MAQLQIHPEEAAPALHFKPMDTIKTYPTFRIEIRPSPDTNDHEVRFITDEDDIIARLWQDMIGLDPDDILGDASPLRCSDQPHWVTVARCNCGVIGCGSVQVEVACSADTVTWTWGGNASSKRLTFHAADYQAEVERAVQDITWETPERTAARLLAGRVDREILSASGLTYSWASGRVRKGMFTVSLCLDPGPYQVLIHLPWNMETPELIADQSAKLLAEPPSSWTSVEWYPQGTRDTPLIAGPGWRRGGH